MPSIHDVALASGLSTATVSRAMRGLPGVSEATRERVRRAAANLNYTPTRAAAVLASGQTNTIAVVVPYVTRWYFAQVVQGAEGVLAANDYDLLLYNLGGDAAIRDRVLGTPLLTRRVDATMILGLSPTPAELASLTANKQPISLVGVEGGELPSVRIDDDAAAVLGVRHLLDLGHTRIAYVGGAIQGVLDFATPRARLHGYRKTLTRAGVALDPALEFDGHFTVAGGIAAGDALLALPQPPTAVFCASDEMAIGVMRSARLAGLRVPEDLSVVGIDDHEMAEHFGLTTVRQPVHLLGSVAAEQLLAALRGNADATGQRVLPTELVVRGTTQALPA